MAVVLQSRCDYWNKWHFCFQWNIVSDKADCSTDEVQQQRMNRRWQWRVVKGGQQDVWKWITKSSSQWQMSIITQQIG